LAPELHDWFKTHHTKILSERNLNLTP